MGDGQAWTYWLDGAALECASWTGGAAPALAMHFHAEDQLTILLSGSRAFRIRGAMFHVEAGQCIHIPAGVPHRSLPVFHAGTRCLNIYARSSGAGGGPVVVDVPEIFAEAGRAEPAVLLHAVGQRLRVSRQDGGKLASPGLLGTEPIAHVASRHGLARESFSRKFASRFGMPPHAYRVVERLNEGRRSLRTGMPVAAVAAELDFADQSHFGRHFRRVFGITPRAYRDGML